MNRKRRESKISGALLHRHLETSFKNLPISEDPLQPDFENADIHDVEFLKRERGRAGNGSSEGQEGIHRHRLSFSENLDSTRYVVNIIEKTSYLKQVREWLSNQSVFELATLLSPLLKQLAEYHKLDDSGDDAISEPKLDSSTNVKESNETVALPNNGNSSSSGSDKKNTKSTLKWPSRFSTTFTHLLRDLKSAITVTLVSVPFAIAYSSLAQVSPVNGLVSASVPSIIYSLIGTSAHICIGPESVVSIMVGMGVRDELAFSGGGSGVRIASCLGMMCGVLGLGMAFFQTGFLADVLAGYLLLGFITGVANLIMIRQVPTLLGMPIAVSSVSDKVDALASQSAINQLFGYLQHIPSSVSLNTVYLSVVSFGFLLLARFVNQKLEKRYPFLVIMPEVLLLFVLSIGLSASLDLENRFGISVLGPFEQSMPTPSLPVMDWAFMSRNLSLACTITLFGFFETVTLIREYGIKNHYFPSGDRILFSLGSVNVIGSVFGGYPTFASPSRSRTQSSSGARSLLVGLLTGSFIITITSTFAQVFQYLPRPVLAVLVFDAATRRIPFKEIQFTLQKRNVQEIVKLLATYLLTISLNPTLGVIFCLILSALVIIRRSTAIHVSVLGEIEVKDDRAKGGQEEEGTVIVRYVDISQHPEAFVIAQVVPLSIKGSLEYFNAARISRRVEMLTDAVSKLSEVEERLDSTKVSSAIRNNSLWIARESRCNDVIVILDLSQVDALDSSAAWEVKKLYEKSNDRILLCGLHMHHLHMLDFVKTEDIFLTMVDALEFVKLLLYSDTVSSSAGGGEMRDYSFENQFSFQSSTGVGGRWLSNRPISTGGEENQYSVRSVRSLRSLHTEWTDHSQSVQNQNQQSVRSGDLLQQLSVRSTISKREPRPVHVRNLFNQVSDVQEEQPDTVIIVRSTSQRKQQIPLIVEPTRESRDTNLQQDPAIDASITTTRKPSSSPHVVLILPSSEDESA